MAKYPNLPGIEVTIADGGLILPEDSTTESLLIIAPCVKQDAPEEPVLVRQSSDLELNGFGTFVEEELLTRLQLLGSKHLRVALVGST
ncbi:hypothetical protein QO179_24755 [Bacillus stercoris]|nr:hypothetical protein [Bacillus stercoris]